MPLIGLISDTHGLLRPEAEAALAGVELILHAGDAGESRVLRDLRATAPVCAVRGNIDRGAWALKLPESRVVEAGGALIWLQHDLTRLALDPVAAGVRVVVTGHTHRPLVFEERGVLYINPGSAGPRRFTLPVSVARLTLKNGVPSAELITLRLPDESYKKTRFTTEAQRTPRKPNRIFRG